MFVQKPSVPRHRCISQCSRWQCPCVCWCYCPQTLANPFNIVDVTDMSEQLASLFSLSASELELEIINLQNDIRLKAHQMDKDFWKLLDPEKFKNIQTAALKLSCLFGSTYRCESAFSDMNFIKSKFRTRLTDEHLNDSIRVNLSGYTPQYSALVDAMQCQVSH